MVLFYPVLKLVGDRHLFDLLHKKNKLMLQGRRQAGFSQTSIFIDKITLYHFVDYHGFNTHGCGNFKSKCLG